MTVVALTVGTLACGPDQQLEQHQQKLESLGASTAAIAEAWLAGSLSPRYTRTAFEQVFLLVEQERAAIATGPKQLADPRAAHLSEAAERLSRLLAAMTRDVESRDTTALRQHASQISISHRQ